MSDPQQKESGSMSDPQQSSSVSQSSSTPTSDNNPSTSYQVLVAEPLGAAGVEQLKSEPDVDARFASQLSRAELLDAVADVDGLIVRSGSKVDAELMEAAPRLRAVGRAGVGVDNIDLTEASRRGILVTNTPSASTFTTAEHAFALMLSVARRVVPAHNSVTAGRWDRRDYVGFQLAGHTLGVVGFGRIGREVALRAKAFAMDVVTSDPFITSDFAAEHGVELLTFEELLAAADVISLHAALSPGDPPLINSVALAAIKPGAIIVNAARGALVDSAAARGALDDGRLGGMGIDVYESEPPSPDHPLVGHPLVVHTPHLGASTFQAQRNVSVHAVNNVLAILRGEPVENAVNTINS